MKQGKSSELALVTDPPFGGRVEPLAYTFLYLDKLYRDLNQENSGPLSCKFDAGQLLLYLVDYIKFTLKHTLLFPQNLTVMWIFPYFMEPMITGSCPGMVMLDYKVEYDNHPLFQTGMYDYPWFRY